jgi:hypothetical protein
MNPLIPELRPLGPSALGVTGAAEKDPDQPGVTRREALQAAAVAMVVLPAALAAQGQKVAAPRFFSAAEFALVDQLSEMIIPTDAQSPGAKAARVADYIDARLAETTDPDWKATWHTGLKLIEDLSNDMHGKAFLATSPDQQLATLTRVAANEAKPAAPLDRFFIELKFRVVRGYYSSRIGIHQDQDYKGNVYQNGEYAGIDAK